MVFSNLFFLYVFLPLHLLLYYLTQNQTVRNCILVLFSLAFYAWGEPLCVLLLIFTACSDYLHGRLIEKHRGTPKATAALVASLVIDLGLLACFKYSGFFVENLNALTGLGLPVPSIALPIGISFYTFQTISYIVDVYRGEIPAQRSLLKYLLFLSLFYQLVAGPIVRYQTVMEDIEHRRPNINDFYYGLCRFTEGLAKKVLIANVAGKLASQYLDSDLSTLSTAGAWAGLLFFTLQIYFDFAGYSSMAIGMGRMTGFHFDENFNYPYISRSITEFWRRWHISLSSFFRDYVYIPLGGKYHHRIRNLCIVWLLTGFWHGASWNFILWGAYFLLFLSLEKLFLSKLLEKLPALLQWVYSIFIVMLGWALFYFTDFSRLWDFLKVLFFAGGTPAGDLALSLTLQNHLFFLIAAILACFPLARDLWQKLLGSRTGTGAVVLKHSLSLLWILLLLLVCTAQLAGQSYNPFLYYRF